MSSKPLKHKAKQFTLPGIPKPPMGRPPSGNMTGQFWMSEFFCIVIKTRAAELGIEPGVYLSELVARDLNAEYAVHHSAQ